MTPRTVARLLSPWKFPGKNIALGCHFLLQGNLPDLEIKPTSLLSTALAGRLFTTEPPGKPIHVSLPRWKCSPWLGNHFPAPMLHCVRESMGLWQLTRQTSLGIQLHSTNTKPLLCDRLCAPSGNTRVHKILLQPWKIQSLV